MSKPFYASKTFWFNVIAFVVLGVLPNFGFVPVVPAGWEPFVLPVVLVVNLILRFITKQPISV